MTNQKLFVKILEVFIFIALCGLAIFLNWNIFLKFFEVQPLAFVLVHLPTAVHVPKNASVGHRWYRWQLDLMVSTYYLLNLPYLCVLYYSASVIREYTVRSLFPSISKLVRLLNEFLSGNANVQPGIPNKDQSHGKIIDVQT